MENLKLFRDIIQGSGSYKFKLAELFDWVLRNPVEYQSMAENLIKGCNVEKINFSVEDYRRTLKEFEKLCDSVRIKNTDL